MRALAHTQIHEGDAELCSEERERIGLVLGRRPRKVERFGYEIFLNIKCSACVITCTDVTLHYMLDRTRCFKNARDVSNIFPRIFLD